MEDLVIAVDDPRRDDVRVLLEAHLAFAHAATPLENVRASDPDRLLDPRMTFVSARASGQLLGIGALRQLDPEHVELKSMHTAATPRRRGVGRALIDHLVAVAAERDARRVSLETGSADDFAPARSLYAGAGFVPCEPFGDHWTSLDNTFMTRVL